MAEKKKSGTGKKIKVELVRSFYGCKEDQIRTVKALGLKKIRQVREFEDTPVVRGMIFKVKHLVKVL